MEMIGLGFGIAVAVGVVALSVASIVVLLRFVE